MKSLRVVGILTAALALSLVMGCPGPGTTGKPEVAFVSNNSDPFWSYAEAGAVKAAGEEDVDLKFRKPDPGDAATQKEVIDTVLNLGVKAIAVSVNDPKNQGPYFKEIASKVPLLTQDNDAPDSGRLCYIGTDNYEAGKAAGRLVKEALPDGGVVVIFVGHLNALNAQQRRQGVLDELAGQKDPKGEEVQEGGVTFMKYGKYRQYGGPALLDMPDKESKALSNAQDALTKLQGEKDVCLVGLWAYEPPMLLTAAENPGKISNVKIVAFDEAPRTLDGVADGRILGTIVQNPYQFGYKSVKIMAALAKGADKTKAGIPADGILYEPYRIITKEAGKSYPLSVSGEKTSMGVATFREELDKLKK